MQPSASHERHTTLGERSPDASQDLRPAFIQLPAARSSRWRGLALIAGLAVVLIALVALAATVLSTWDRIR